MRSSYQEKKKDGTKICAVCRSVDEITAQTMKQNQEKIEELILETSAGFSQQDRELKAQKRDINALQANVDRHHREINSTKLSVCEQKKQITAIHGELSLAVHQLSEETRDTRQDMHELKQTLTVLEKELAKSKQDRGKAKEDKERARLELQMKEIESKPAWMNHKRLEMKHKELMKDKEIKRLEVLKDIATTMKLMKCNPQQFNNFVGQFSGIPVIKEDIEPVSMGTEELDRKEDDGLDERVDPPLPKDSYRLMHMPRSKGYNTSPIAIRKTCDS